MVMLAWTLRGSPPHLPAQLKATSPTSLGYPTYQLSTVSKLLGFQHMAVVIIQGNSAFSHLAGSRWPRTMAP